MLASALLALSQPAATASLPAPPPSIANDRLQACMAKARTDPATAISEASAWAAEVNAEGGSYAQQCLGMAYTSLLRWQAAEQAFLAAREAADAADHPRRARLADMAGNAALQAGRGDAALQAFAQGASDAETASDTALRAVIETDRARALVAAGRTAEAEAALASARTLDPQSPFAWLLSATLARRLGKLDDAQNWIETAAALAPDYPETALEAGVIAMLRGDEAAAARNWHAVLELEPDGETAETARGYLAQVEDPVGR